MYVCVLSYDTLATRQWQAMSHFGVSRAVDRVAKFAEKATNGSVQDWGAQYRAAMIDAVIAMTHLHVFHHQEQVREPSLFSCSVVVPAQGFAVCCPMTLCR